jgi:hypothetical protein
MAMFVGWMGVQTWAWRVIALPLAVCGLGISSFEDIRLVDGKYMVLTRELGMGVLGNLSDDIS